MIYRQYCEELEEELSDVLMERDEARKLAEEWRDRWEDSCCCSVCQGHRLPWEEEHKEPKRTAAAMGGGEMNKCEQCEERQALLFQITNSLRDVTIQRDEARRLAEECLEWGESDLPCDCRVYSRPVLPWRSV